MAIIIPEKKIEIKKEDLKAIEKCIFKYPENSQGEPNLIMVMLKFDPEIGTPVFYLYGRLDGMTFCGEGRQETTSLDEVLEWANNFADCPPPAMASGMKIISDQ